MAYSTSNLSPKNSELFQKSVQLMNSHHSLDEIKKVLQKETSANEEEISDMLKHIKILMDEKVHHRGRILVLVGAILLLAGFVFTFLNIYSNQSVHFAMYGLTSIGLLVIFAGLYFIFN